MRDDLRQLARRDAVFQRQGHLEAQFDRLVTGDQRGNNHDAAIARRQAWSCPQITEHALAAVLLQRGRHRGNVAHRERIFKSCFR
jgi:hypothetical protein